MKNLSKNLVITFLFVIGFSAASFSQITKADVEKMMVTVGTNAESITTIWIANDTYVSQGAVRYKNIEFTEKKFVIADSGLMVLGDDNVTLYAYTSIKSFFVNANTVTISMIVN